MADADRAQANSSLDRQLNARSAESEAERAARKEEMMANMGFKSQESAADRTQQQGQFDANLGFQKENSERGFGLQKENADRGFGFQKENADRDCGLRKQAFDFQAEDRANDPTRLLNTMKMKLLKDAMPGDEAPGSVEMPPPVPGENNHWMNTDADASPQAPTIGPRKSGGDNKILDMLSNPQFAQLFGIKPGQTEHEKKMEGFQEQIAQRQVNGEMNEGQKNAADAQDYAIAQQQYERDMSTGQFSDEEARKRAVQAVNIGRIRKGLPPLDPTMSLADAPKFNYSPIALDQYAMSVAGKSSKDLLEAAKANALTERDAGPGVLNLLKRNIGLSTPGSYLGRWGSDAINSVAGNPVSSMEYEQQLIKQGVNPQFAREMAKQAGMRK